MRPRKAQRRQGLGSGIAALGLSLACGLAGCSIDFGGLARPGWDADLNLDAGSAEDGSTPDATMDAAVDAGEPLDAGLDGGPPDAGSCDPAACPGLRCVGTECGYFTDCQGLLDSGLAPGSDDYRIRPAGMATPVTAFCDMSNDGGGWTLVFLAETDNYDRDLSAYTEPGALFVLDAASEALLAFRSVPSNRSISAGTNWARIAMPTQWRSAFPTAVAGDERSVMTLVEGEATPSVRQLRYGSGEFRLETDRTGGCDSDWASWDVDFGRICIRGTDAPFYSATHSSRDDHCVGSGEDWETTRCGASRRFSIAVR